MENWWDQTHVSYEILVALSHYSNGTSVIETWSGASALYQQHLASLDSCWCLSTRAEFPCADDSPRLTFLSVLWLRSLLSSRGRQLDSRHSVRHTSQRRYYVPMYCEKLTKADSLQLTAHSWHEHWVQEEPGNIGEATSGGKRPGIFLKPGQVWEIWEWIVITH